jgi:hypothetical protein
MGNSARTHGCQETDRDSIWPDEEPTCRSAELGRGFLKLGPTFHEVLSGAA